MTKHYITLLTWLVSIVKIIAISAGVLMISFFVFLFCYLLIYTPWAIKHGYDSKGAGYKWYLAMKDGNSKEAIYWAKRHLAYWIIQEAGMGEWGEHRKSRRDARIRDTNSCLDRVRPIAEAYELDGQIEMACLWYAISERAKEKESFSFEILFVPPPSPFQGRLYFKQGKRKEAFQSYCGYGMYCLDKYACVKELEQNADRVGSGAYYERRTTLAKIRDEITMSQQYSEMRLTPFLDYKDFIVFMEEEYEKLGTPAEYMEAMELFRTINAEIGEEDINQHGGSDRLNEMKETIRQERSPIEK